MSQLAYLNLKTNSLKKRLHLEKAYRDDRGYSILEMAVAVTVLVIVVSLLYLYNNKGSVFFDKIFNFDRLQLNSKSATELLMNNLRESSREYVFIGQGFNNRVPLPNDLISGSEYIYFAKFIPDKENTEIQGIKDSISRKTNGHYDYYLVYQAQIQNANGSYLSNRAKLKTVVFPDQSIEHTDFNAEDWPFLPKYENTELNKIKSSAFLDYLELNNESPVFSFKNSVIDFNYADGSQLLDKKLILFRIRMIDEKEKVLIDLSSSVVPRN